MDFFEQWTREASGLDDSRLETQNHFAYTDTFSVGQPLLHNIWRPSTAYGYPTRTSGQS